MPGGNETGSREFKMLRRQRDQYGQNKIIHINGNKENLLFIINHMILIRIKKLMTQPYVEKCGR